MSYNNDIAASDAKLAAFDAGSAGLQQDIQQQLEQQQFTNNLATNQDTRAQSTQDHNFSQDTITNNRNTVNDKATFTGDYTSPETSAIQQQMAKNSAEYATASPEQQAVIHQNNLDLAKQLGQTYDPGTGTYSGGNTSTRTLAGQTQDMNNVKDMAVLTGKMPDGTPTNAAQQEQLKNLWTVADQTGTIPNSLADFYGLPHGMQTQAAKTQAIQNGISQQGATTSAKNATTAETNSKNSQENATQDNLMNIWKATGKAPSGINGVTEGTPFAGTAKAASTADDFIKSIDNTPLVSNIAGMRRVTDPVALEKAILDSGMTPEEMTKAYRAYNIPMK